MPPSPHLPSDVRAAMQREEGQRTGQWKHQSHPVRDASKKSIVNNPLAAPVQLLVSGTKQMPCILMKFPDYANTYSTTDFKDLLFTPGGVPTGSAADYYTEVSFNKLTLSGKVQGWYTTDYLKSHYGDRTGRYADCAYEAAKKADAAGFDWAPYDNDHDGYVDTLWVVHSGLGAEETGNTRTDIWSHSWDFASAGKGVFTTSTPDSYNGGYIKINNYIIQPETSFWSGGDGLSQGIVGIGVFCHEFGHALGLPDLYDTSGTGEGLGNASLMAAGSWGGDGNDSRYPAHMDAWCKVDLGWISPSVVTSDGPYSIMNTELNSTQSCYLVKPSGSAVNQYFLVENRQHNGYDQNLFATGLFIYHIDTDIINTYMYANTVNSNTHPYGVALEEADAVTDSYAAMHLFTGSNRGLSSDSWPKGSSTAFGAASIPSTKTNAGAIQKCSIANISAKGDEMTATISVTPSANAAPTANSDSYKATVNKTLTVRAPGVLSNDTDSDGDPLTVATFTQPANGTLVMNTNGSFTYKPNTGYTGTDTFTYNASDGITLSNVTTVTISVTKKGK